MTFATHIRQWSRGLIIIAGAMASMALAGGPSERSEAWAPRSDMHAEVGGREAKVFQDPLFPWHVLIFDKKNAWIVKWDYEGIRQANRNHFELRDGRLTYDQTYRADAEPGPGG